MRYVSANSLHLDQLLNIGKFKMYNSASRIMEIEVHTKLPSLRNTDLESKYCYFINQICFSSQIS